MPQVRERIVATGRGVRAERDLAQAAADFYVLEPLTARGDADAAKMLAHFEACLAGEFACYLDMAIGASSATPCSTSARTRCPPSSPASFARSDPGERGMAWMAWTVVRRVLGLRALQFAAHAFGTSGWAENFGGEAWATVARFLRDHLRGVSSHECSSTSASASSTTPGVC
jgi:hypothetical protein